MAESQVSLSMGEERKKGKRKIARPAPRPQSTHLSIASIDAQEKNRSMPRPTRAAKSAAASKLAAIAANEMEKPRGAAATKLTGVAKKKTAAKLSSAEKSAGVAAKKKKAAAPTAKEVLEATQNLVDCYNLVLPWFDFNAAEPIEKINAAHVKDMDEQVSTFPGVLDMTMFANELQRVEEKYNFCSFCDRMLFTARQTFMHFASVDHIAKVTEKSNDHLQMTNVLIKMIGRERADMLFKQEEEQVEKQQKKWASLALGDPSLRPSGRYPSFDEWFNSEPPAVRARMGGDKSPNELANLATGIIERRGFGDEQMARISQDIGRAKTRCLACKLIFADANEYYEHLLTYYHISKENTFDFITILVNIKKRNLARKEPWP